MAKHTPTPWKIGLAGESSSAVDAVFEKDGQKYFTHVCTAENSNAAFIVEACNGWNDAEALKRRLAELEG